jgi:signal transduction histidine kinase
MDTSETTIFHAVLIAAVIIGGIFIFFLLSIIKLHRRQLRLQKSKREAEILLLDRERTRFAADLHDELGPILSAAKFKMNEVDPPSPDEKILLHQASDHIDNIISRIRQIANGLMPNTLLRKGPVYAIEEFIHSVTEAFPLHIELSPYNVPSFPQAQSIHIYRILQEIIHNTIKHAKASRLRIQMFPRSGKLIILCNDDGVGFNTAKVSKEKTGGYSQHS